MAVSLALFVNAQAKDTSNLLVNGHFTQTAGQTVTPPGWVNVGHEDGLIPYTNFPQQPTFGSSPYFYDTGGYGYPPGVIGDGLAQTVVTTPGALYTLRFGASAENLGSASETLTVNIGSMSTSYTFTPTGSGVFTRPFVAYRIPYTATSTSTTLSFILSSAANGMTGNNDPMIAGVTFMAGDLSIAQPTEQQQFPLSQNNYIASLPVSFLANSSDTTDTINWSTTLSYETSGGRGHFQALQNFMTKPGTSQSETYTSMGGRLTADVSQGTGSDEVRAYIVGTPIPSSIITSELAGLYTGGATPNLLEQIADYESSYTQFTMLDDYDQMALWPTESYDGGSHIGLMQVKTSSGGFPTAFDWTQNAQAGATLFIGNLTIAKHHLHRIRNANPGLVDFTPQMVEDEALSFYNVGTAFDYWTVGTGTNGHPKWVENSSGDPAGTVYADCVREQTPPVRVQCP